MRKRDCSHYQPDTTEQAGAVGNSLIIRRPQAMKCEVEDDLSNEGCTLDMLPELELLAMLERRGINGTGVDISAAIELLQGIQNDATEAQNSNPPLHVDRDDDNLDFIISDDADESVLEEAFVCAGDGMVKDNNHTPNKVHDLQYPYGYYGVPKQQLQVTEETRKTNQSNVNSEEKSSQGNQFRILLEQIVEIWEEMKTQVHSDFNTILSIFPTPIREVIPRLKTAVRVSLDAIEEKRKAAAAAAAARRASQSRDANVTSPSLTDPEE